MKIYFKIKAFFFISIFLLPQILLAESYEDCVLKNVPKAKTSAAAEAIESACFRKSILNEDEEIKKITNDTRIFRVIRSDKLEENRIVVDGSVKYTNGALKKFYNRNKRKFNKIEDILKKKGLYHDVKIAKLTRAKYKGKPAVKDGYWAFEAWFENEAKWPIDVVGLEF